MSNTYTFRVNPNTSERDGIAQPILDHWKEKGQLRTLLVEAVIAYTQKGYEPPLSDPTGHTGYSHYALAQHIVRGLIDSGHLMVNPAHAEPAGGSSQEQYGAVIEGMEQTVFDYLSNIPDVDVDDDDEF